ncbi:LPS-assembly protein LptD [Candidatus Aminicenantes bacterium AH-873-B07]|nr:LPS-assembly protein LptD [Candidatus Aminicenantes bacterium AH-873-B07]
MLFRIVYIFCFILFFLINISFTQETKQNPDTPKIIAKLWERQGKILYFSGEVEVHYEDIIIYADYIEYNEDTQDLIAEGNVSIHMPDQVISGKKIIFNIRTRQGEIVDAYGMIQPTTFYQAKKLSKIGEDLYQFDRATLTTCIQPVPRWKFSCSQGKLKRDEYLELKNSVLWIKKFPVFYIPYLKYPLKKRSTGFLAPELGYSAYKGYIASEAFFWAIKRNLDATFNFDYFSEQGIGSGLEFRYIFPNNTRGNLNFYFFKYLYKPEYNYDYVLRFQHNQTLFYDFKLVANIDHQSSLYFLKEFDNNFNRATISTYISQAYLFKNWTNLNFYLRADRYVTYFSRVDRSLVIYHFPQLNLNLLRTKLIEPLYFSFSTSFDRVYRGYGKTTYGINRFRFNPSLSIPFSKIPWLSLNAVFSLRQIYYLNYRRKVDSKIFKLSDEPISKRYYVIRFDLLGPTFYRIYYGPENTSFEKFKHIIEPQISYQYSVKYETSKRWLLFDYYDYPAYHQLRYSLTNRLLIKKGETPFEILTWTIGQTYYFNPKEVLHMRYFKINGETPHFSDIYSSLRIRATAKYSLDFNLSYNYYYRKLSGMSLIANLGVPEDNLFIRLSWFQRKILYVSEYHFANYNQIRVYTGFKIPKIGIESSFEVDHDFIQKKTLYAAFSVIYHYQCIDFKGEVKIFNFREKPDIQFRFSIGFGNIGRVADFLGGIGF